MKRILSGLLAFNLILALGACGDTDKSVKQAAAYVASEDSKTYTSTYFDLSLDKPDNWHSQDQAFAEQLLNIGSDMVAGDDPNMKATMDISMQRSLAICVFSRHPMDEERAENALFMSVSENVRMAPQVRTGADYFDQMKLLAKSSAVSVQYSDTYGQKMIDGQTFGTMTATYDIAGADIPPQEYYAARHDDHMIVFIATYTSAEDRQAVKGIIDSIKLDW